MNSTTPDTRDTARMQAKPAAGHLSRALRPVRSKQIALSLAWTMCAALGATSVQAFTAKQRVMVAGVVARGIVICDGEHSYSLSESELSRLLDEVECLC
jgi:hypothetical protein